MSLPRRVAVVAADLAAVAAVAALPVAVHVLVPAPIRAGLAFDYGAFDPLTALSAAYVHVDLDHATGNAVGYLVPAVAAYLVCLFAGRRRWYWFTTLALLTVLPVAVHAAGALQVALAAPGLSTTGRGFSGVVAGFAGFLLVSLPTLLDRFGYPPWVARNALFVGVLVVVAAAIRGATGTIPRGVGIVVLAGVVLVLVAVGRGLAARWPVGRVAWGRHAGAAAALAILLATLAWHVETLFSGPANRFAHYAGLVFGATVARWGRRYWSPRRRGRELAAIDRG